MGPFYCFVYRTMGQLIMFLCLVLLGILKNTECQLDGFKSLQKSEKEILKSVVEVLDIGKKSDIGIVGAQKHMLDNVHLSGSITEGSGMAALFKPSTNGKGVTKELGVGVTFDILQIPNKYKDLVEDVDGNVGYVKVRVNEDALGYLASMNLNLVSSKEYRKLLPEIVQDGFLKPYKLKHLVLKTMEEKTGYAPSTIDGMTELFWAVVLDAKVDKLKISKPKHELSKLPTSSFVDVFVEKKLKLKLSWNIATTIKLEWWPSIAQEFVDRQRQWPDKETIKKLTQESFITLIPSGGEGDGEESEESQELVYTFTNVEKALSALRTDGQSLVYLIFRSLLYKHAVGTSDTVAKHIMLWACEELPRDHPLWSESSPEQAIPVLLGKLLAALESKNLPNYFVAKQNLIGGLDETAREEQIKKIHQILATFPECIPQNAKEATAASKDIQKTIQTTHKVIQDLANENYDVFMKRVDLIPKALEIFGLNMMSLMGGGGSGGKKKVDDFQKTMGNVKDSPGGLWGDLTDTLKSEDVQDTIKSVKDNFDLDDLEKKAKEWMDKWEL